MRRIAMLTLAAALAAACGNDPYPDADATRRILYAAFTEPPKTLDPQVAYSTVDHMVTGAVYDKLLEYDFLARPYRLIPGIAREVPTAEPQADGRVAYRLRLRDDLLYADDPCFALGAAGRTTRQVVAGDVAFAIERIADPAVDSPVVSTFAHIVGFGAFRERLAALRKTNPSLATRHAVEQYTTAGGVDGIHVLGPTDLEIVLAEPYPQILYWFAMEFTSPVPWEAVAYYDGDDGRDAFTEHPVGSGPYRLALYNKRSRIVLERNPTWYGIQHPEWHAPAAVYPSEGESSDAARGLLDPAYVGRPLPFIERVELRMEKEEIPAFTKFRQGYYDASGIVEESFDRVVKEGGLSSDMAALGMRLDRTVEPAVFYLGFNMQDPVVGDAPGERGRKLRQAMSLVVDTREYTRIFQNGRGVPAESPLPPGIFGYDPDYRNPFRQVDVVRARVLLREAGYPDGIDPKTGQPLHLTFDSPDTSARSRLRFQFFCDEWRQLGIDVEIAATDYNQFQDKVRRGAYQLFLWGWSADYPDPENFLFLLWSDMARSRGGENTANFVDPEYDRIFLEMRDRPNDDRRRELIDELRSITERERPWIELFFPERYQLTQGWLHNVKPLGMSFSTLKYEDVDPLARRRAQIAWNKPLLWPAYALAGIIAVVLAPGVLTVLRRRR